MTTTTETTEPSLKTIVMLWDVIHEEDDAETPFSEQLASSLLILDGEILPEPGLFASASDDPREICAWGLRNDADNAEFWREIGRGERYTCCHNRKHKGHRLSCPQNEGGSLEREECLADYRKGVGL